MTTVSELPSPLTLLPRAQAGDEHAMNHLLTAITPYVARICRSITHDDGADATQEALLAVYRGLGSLREPAAFYGWVRSVTVREAVRTARRYGAESCCSEVDSREETNPLDAVHISDVLERLSQAHRQVLTLRAYGLSEEEMAEVLALPLGTVRSRLFRARRRFQEAWQPSAA
ncbi:RNA polymerase sigma factor [Streptomyces althioticus]|uniref:RNA polymerase sigma factor n=1 Tax=Actinomycetes TaxID=1760 RepID=UPI0005279CB4|nr:MULTISPECIES: sigma-70 family RNA polymerase sigma factor [Actinomycetes]ALV48228.1 RNA polymerase subunit sigma-24 [Streptomyces sp. 4F]MCC9690515.1 sigma-70 family RNA polymerase sigma factor [Streptomyces sp. MNU103]WTC27285.1 sigma-70 family RNA polymerase sigma factor [Streptomyces althioticus]GGT37682.1 RNA polymerase sigma24 factor [Streptomyces matensis]MBM4832959.1 sigma-70 family RNA polymerase sigma factor [Actinospica acidiphila]